MAARPNQRRSKRAMCLAALLAFTSFIQRAAAQDRPRDEPANAERAAQDGAFLPFSGAASHAERKASVMLASGYDGGGNSALFRGQADATLYGPVGLRVGAAYDALSPSSRPFVGGFADVLQQSKHGINLSLQGRFESSSFNTVPGIALGFAVSRRLDHTLLTASAEYGSGLRDRERNGAAGLAALQQLASHFQLGLDSRFQIDLERDLDEPKDEPDWRALGGPLLIASYGAFAASVGGGVSALRYRLANTTHVGPTAFAGLGASF